MRESEDIERGLSDEIREELRNAKTLLETGKLLQRLKKTHRINRFTQAALVASLVLSVGLWAGSAGSIVKVQTENSTSNKGNAVALAAPQIVEPVALNNLKLSANLETASPLQAGMKEGKQAEREF